MELDDRLEKEDRILFSCYISFNNIFDPTHFDISSKLETEKKKEETYPCSDFFQ